MRYNQYMNTTTTTSNNSRIAPSLDDTLAIWAHITKSGPKTVASFVGAVARNHPAGRNHVSIGVHRSNTSQLIRQGRLAFVGDSFGAKTYKVAAQ